MATRKKQTKKSPVAGKGTPAPVVIRMPKRGPRPVIPPPGMTVEETKDVLAKLRRLGISRKMVKWEGSRLVGVGFEDFIVSPGDVRALRRMGTMKSITLNGSRFEDDVLLSLRTHEETLWHVGVFRTNMSDSGVRYLRNLDRLRELDLHGNRVTDDGMKYVGELTRLTRLSIQERHVLGPGLAELTGLKNVVNLDLGKSGVRGPGLEALVGLKNLKTLSLLDTHTADAGLASVATLGQIEELDLSETRITNAGLEHLARMKNLRKLVVRSTKVNAAGIRKLQGSLKRLTVER